MKFLAIKKVKAPVKIAMSGTPVENRMSEYWSIFDFANKGFLGTLNNFGKQYAKPIEQNADQSALNKFKNYGSVYYATCENRQVDYQRFAR